MSRDISSAGAAAARHRRRDASQPCSPLCDRASSRARRHSHCVLRRKEMCISTFHPSIDGDVASTSPACPALCLTRCLDSEREGDHRGVPAPIRPVLICSLTGCTPAPVQTTMPLERAPRAALPQTQLMRSAARITSKGCQSIAMSQRLCVPKLRSRVLQSPTRPGQHVQSLRKIETTSNERNRCTVPGSAFTENKTQSLTSSSQSTTMRVRLRAWTRWLGVRVGGLAIRQREMFPLLDVVVVGCARGPWTRECALNRRYSRITC